MSAEQRSPHEPRSVVCPRKPLEHDVVEPEHGAYAFRCEPRADRLAPARRPADCRLSVAADSFLRGMQPPVVFLAGQSGRRHARQSEPVRFLMRRLRVLVGFTDACDSAVAWTVLFANLVVAAPRDPLDGRSFTVAVAYTNGNLKTHAQMTFARGALTTNIEFDGAKSFAYKATSKDGVISFSASATTGSGEMQKTISWDGKVDSHAITGTLVIVQKGLGSHLMFSGGEMTTP